MGKRKDIHRIVFLLPWLALLSCSRQANDKPLRDAANIVVTATLAPVDTTRAGWPVQVLEGRDLDVLGATWKPDDLPDDADPGQVLGDLYVAMVTIGADALRRLSAWEGPRYRLRHLIVGTPRGPIRAGVWIAPGATTKPWRET